MNDLIDPKLKQVEVEAVAALFAGEDEIAAYFDTSVDVIEEFYSKNVQRGRLKGKIKVRQLMMELAEKDKDPKAIAFIAQHFLGSDGGKI